MVSYDGTSKIYTKSIQDLGSFDTEELNWVNSNGKLYRWLLMPPEDKQDLDKIFPVLSNTLKPMFGIPFDIPTFENRYPKYLNFINTFYETYLNTVAFKKIIPLANEGFIKVSEEKTLRTKLNSNELTVTVTEQDSFSRRQIILIVVGVIFWILVLLGLNAK